MKRKIPYASQSAVGSSEPCRRASVLAADGSTVVEGCNVENASYGGTICAERVALTAAVAQGLRAFTALAVVTENGGAPCGLCRQVMAELGPEMTVYIADAQGRYRTTTVRELLPAMFTGASLPASSHPG